MSSRESIRGTALKLAAEDLRRLLQCGSVDHQAIGERFGDDADLVLHGDIDPVAWYPVELCAEVVALLVERQGGDEPLAYLKERGARAADAIIKGNYGPVSDDNSEIGKSLGNMLAQLGSAILNFGEWKFHYIERGMRHSLRFSGSAALPEELRHTTAGFVQALAERTSGRAVQVDSERHGDELTYYITFG